MTAAHCVDGAEASRVDVLLGAHRLSDGGLTVRAEDILVHPDYDPFLSDSDLALIHLSEPVTYTPISLYRTIPDETEQSHVRATTIGWGASDIGDFFSITYPDALREVSIPLVDFDTCYSAYGGGITENMLCAGYEKLLKGSCYGDSGGPLMVQDKAGEWLQVGIVSFGPYGCISFGLYDVFTRVGAFTDWIDACVANMDTAACNGADLYEPDNSMAAARVYTDFGTPEMHTFHVAGDQDWLRFDVKKDHLYVVSTASVNDFTTLVDTVIWLFEDDGFTPITYNDEGPSIPFISQVASWAVRNRLGAELELAGLLRRFTDYLAGGHDRLRLS